MKTRHRIVSWHHWHWHGSMALALALAWHGMARHGIMAWQHGIGSMASWHGMAWSGVYPAVGKKLISTTRCPPARPGRPRERYIKRNNGEHGKRHPKKRKKATHIASKVTKLDILIVFVFLCVFVVIVQI